MGFSGRMLECLAISFTQKRILPSQGIKPRSPALRQIHYCLSHQGRPVSRQLSIPCVLTWWEGWEIFLGSLYIRTLIPLSWPNYFPKALSLNTITLTVRISIYEWIETTVHNTSCVHFFLLSSIAVLNWTQLNSFIWDIVKVDENDLSTP